MKANAAVMTGLTVCLLSAVGPGWADDKDAPKDVEITIPGEWKSRPAGNEKAAWATEKTPAKVAIKPDQVYAFDPARDVTDEQLAGLKSLKDVPVRNLTVSSAKMTDAGAAHIAQLGSLRYLYLSACSGVTDEGVKEIAKLPELENLWLTANPRITDEGVKSLAGMKALNWVSLFGCKGVTDDGARQLGKLTGLKFAFFGGTGVTEQGVADLKKALPKCDVKR